MKMSPVMKITTAAMLMCLAIIFNKLLVLQFSAVPFIRIGIAAVPVIVAGVILGPLYGLFVGAAADVIGFFLFDTTGFGYTPFVTISFAIYGTLPALILMITKKLRYGKKPIPVIYGLMGAILAFLIVFLALNDQVKVTGHIYTITLLWKILIPFIVAVVFSFFTLVIYWTNRKFQKTVLEHPGSPSPNEIAFMVLCVLLVVDILWGAFWKSIFFQADYLAVFFSQCLILIFAFPIDTLLLTAVFTNYYRLIDKARSNKVD